MLGLMTCGWGNKPIAPELGGSHHWVTADVAAA